MTIPTATEFTQQFGSGPNINQITNELGDYWTTINNTNSSVVNCINAYRALIAKCQDWLKKKAKKSEFETVFGVATSISNTKFLRRRNAIAAIAEDATGELMLFLQQNNLLTADLRGQLSFDIRKFREKGNQIAVRHNTKSLHAGYQQERQTYLSSGKTSAISGSKIHGFHKSGEVMALALRDQNKFIANRGNFNSNQKNAVKAVLGESGGTAKQWKIISELSHIGDMRVAFLKKNERYRYMALINQGLFEDTAGQQINHGTALEPAQVLWTMDKYGNMFIYDERAVNVQLGIFQVNHSSMNAGNEVMCAGMISVLNGQVTYISNTSGHYKPTAAHLSESLSLLNDEGLDLSQAEIYTVDFRNPPAPNQCWWVSWNLVLFINSRGTAGELNRQAGPMP